MNFLKRTFTSGLGASAGLAVYLAVSSFLVWGHVSVLHLVLNSLIFGMLFGVFYTWLHPNQDGTFLSSVCTGFAFVLLALVFSLIGGTFSGFSLASVLALIALSLVLGGGAFAGSRFGE